MSSAPHPKIYSAYGFTKKGGPLEPITFDWKDPQPGEIVVKVLACGVCASDEAAKHQGVPAVRYPIVPGHEIVGEVAAIPSTESKWKLGQVVGSGWHGGHCHLCATCRVGDYMMCEKQDVNGILRHGGYAQTEAVCAVPDGMDPAEVAPLFCAGVTMFNGLRNMSARPPDYVAIQGIGGLGHLGIQFAKAMGYRPIALSSSDAKEELSKTLGAEVYVDGSKVDQAEALQELGGAKLIMCTAPNADVIRTLLPGLAVGGELCVVALTGEAPINLGALVTKRLSVRGWPSGVAPDSEDCVKFAKVHGIRTMVQKFPLEKAEEAYNHRSTARFRAVIIP
ncbi:predicted protein [Postia placenta Mad-698-R]|nr:predicted protein [Postia placenta Mad-698-R]